MKYPAILFHIFLSICSTQLNAHSTCNALNSDIPDHTAYYPGGDSALYQYIYSHVILPDEVLREGLSGLVVVSFVVNADSTLSEIEIKKTYHPGSGEAVAKVFSDMPKWAPAIVNGQAISSTKYVPVKFKLEPRQVSTIDLGLKFIKSDNALSNFLNETLKKEIIDKYILNKGIVLIEIKADSNGNFEKKLKLSFSTKADSVAFALTDKILLWKNDTLKSRYLNTPIILPFNFNLNEIEFQKSIDEYVTYGDNKIHENVEEMAEFPGGMGQMMSFVGSTLKYPINAKQKISGIVVAEFIIERDGSVTNIKIFKGIGKEYDDEVIKVIEQMPKWKPGIINGNPVRVKMKMPVKFGYEEKILR